MSSAPIAAAPVPAETGPRRRFFAWLHRHPRVQLGGLLLPPIGVFGLIYLGSLVVLLVSAFWHLEDGEIVRRFGLDNFQRILEKPVYQAIVFRTVGVAAVVTICDAIIAFPIAFYMARVASPRRRSILTIAVLLPLWASYLVRVYAWRVILSENGILEWTLQQVGLGGAASLFGISDLSMTIVFVYLWLPFMILPLFAGLERIPSSVLEASADLGAGGGMTFRQVVLPLVRPALFAGSIFTFSLTLGDYITPELVSNTQFIGNTIADSQGVAGDTPFAATLAMVTISIMAIYLLVARRFGAFEAL
jgi:putative spermidine/putrescine transport system permease protein